ncbi:hypothetical protein [Flagellimonas sp. S3867]|nr:hypothetical protein [Flagellimonas sp. S3867]
MSKSRENERVDGQNLSYLGRSGKTIDNLQHEAVNGLLQLTMDNDN